MSEPWQSEWEYPHRSEFGTRTSLEGVARELVGRVGLKQALAQLRACMHLEALSRTRGSRRAAAALLKVDRRYVQRMANGAPEAEVLSSPLAANRLDGTVSR